jgi:hypothetical protein
MLPRGERGSRDWRSPVADQRSPGRCSDFLPKLDLPQTQDSSRLEATLSLGDAEPLDRMRERCDQVQARPGGASCLVDAALPADPAVPPSLKVEPGSRQTGDDHPVN